MGTALRPEDQQTWATAATSSRSQAEANLCTICLSAITERAVASPCNHLDFDFHCLVQWLQASASCPLCKAQVAEVQYDFRSVNDYKRYKVPKLLQRTQEAASTPFLERQSATDSQGDGCIEQESSSLTRRRQIYTRGLVSQHVGSNATSGYNDFTPQAFSESNTMQSRARVFLRRELRVFNDHFSDLPALPTSARLRKRRGASITTDYMIEYMVAILKVHDLKSFDGQAQELISEFISPPEARILVHELDAWLRSPFARLQEWDDVVQYDTALQRT